MEQGANVRAATNNYGLGLASGKGYLEVVKYLVKHGANISADND